MKFTYYGHSAFTLSDDVTTILFDPFITDNPWTQVCPTDIACQYIIVTHCLQSFGSRRRYCIGSAYVG